MKITDANKAKTIARNENVTAGKEISRPDKSGSIKKRKTKKQQSQESFEKLMACACKLFIANGYKATTLESIAAGAKLTKGAVYFHFGTKEALLHSLLDRAKERIVDPIIEALSTDCDSVKAALVHFMHVHAGLGLTKRDEMLLLITMSMEFAGQKNKISRHIRELYQLLYTHLEETIAQGQKSGEIKLIVPTRELASIVIALHDGIFIEWSRQEMKMSGDDLIRAARSLIVNGLFDTRQ
ncbi:TetR/AcrR family transcriptional regulator [uncultured Sneathiella sp.]|uniref:TetR/AcrR family transcriptional regulator n=1 Tax=uncultured Sneathiella sp. TaxID=879315 RepID=UPI0030ECB669|tara:strand:- start:8606 stop:9325 length:720 start_codon:yes stop_codon:yes gene_type:complete